MTFSLVRQPGYEADRIWTPGNVMPPREENIGFVEAICELVKAGFGISMASAIGLFSHSSNPES